MIVLKSRNEFNKLIVKRGLSRRGFARKYGLSESTFIRISNGKQSPRPETAKKICDALQMDFDDIFEIKNQDESSIKI